MATTTPLFLLLDGILSQDHAQAISSMQAISQLLQGRGTPLLLPSADSSLLTSALNLTEVVRQLLNAHPEMASIPSPNDGSLPIHFAASIGNVQAASYIVEKFPKGVSTPNKKGKLPLHYAAREGRTDMVCFLLRLSPQTAPVATWKDKLALHFAAGEGHLEMVRTLLRVYPNGALRPSKKGKLPLHFAARWGHVRIAHELLLVAPGSIAEVDWEGSLPIHEAAREGDYNMCKFLLERYPKGVCRANMRGEIPLFPAIRAANLDLVILFIRVWPRGGKHILQTVREVDNVASWSPLILEMCLRGAVGNFTGSHLVKGRVPPSDCAGDSVDPCDLALSPIGCSQNPAIEVTGKTIKETGVDFCVSTQHELVPTVMQQSDELVSNGSVRPALKISLPRSKSPILGQTDGDRKKRSSNLQYLSASKRLRSGSNRGEEACARDSNQRPFIHLHAAIECGASNHVIRCILKQYPRQLTEADDLEQFPLHKAVANCRRDDEISLAVDDILKPCPWISKKRDMKGQLPLHTALKACADFRVIKPLIEANTPASVDLCMVNDIRFRSVPPLLMAAEHDCNLSTVYTLLRADPSILDVNTAVEVNLP